MSYKLRVTSYKLRVMSYELRVTSYELRGTSYELCGWSDQAMSGVILESDNSHFTEINHCLLG